MKSKHLIEELEPIMVSIVCGPYKHTSVNFLFFKWKTTALFAGE